MDKEPITVNGLKNLKSELDNLKNVQRPKIVDAIAEARPHGDLKEKGMKEGVLIGKTIKLIEKEWLDNDFEISNERVLKIIEVQNN